MAKKKEKNTDLQLLSLELQSEVAVLDHCLKLLKSNIDLLQNGDSKGLCWNGENALKTNKALVGHYDHDMVLLENVKKCSQYIESVASKKNN